MEVNLKSKQFDYSKLKNVLVHEAQHLIQKAEGFARGGSSEEYDKYVANVKSEYSQFRTQLFRDVVKEELGVDVPYNHAVSMINDIFKGDTENKSYIYKENKISRDQLLDAMKKRVQELMAKEEEYRDKTYDAMPKSSNEFYNRLAGEIEARNTEARMNMTDEERKATPVEETQDIKNADAIIMFDDGTSVNYSDKNKMYYQEGVKQASGHVVKPYTDRDNPSICC